MENKKLRFRVHTLKLLNEIVDSGLAPNMGVFKIPINVFKNLLAEVALRATKINDPELNILMLRLALYEVEHNEISDMIDEQTKLIKV